MTEIKKLPCVRALMNYGQADMDGVIVTASRQAIHETVEALEAALSQVEVMKEALEAYRDAAWRRDSSEVRFDHSVMFSKAYNFDGLGYARREFAGELGWAVVWPDDWPKNERWNYYCEPEGTMPTITIASEREAMAAAEAVVSPKIAALSHTGGEGS